MTYVWFDALTNYLSAVGFGTDPERFEQWWPVDYHLIGKDIIRQHCVYWPAMLLSAGIEPPKGWAVGGWLLSGGEKMSKTTGNVVKPLDLVDTVGVDGFRYYVLADTPYGQDGDFTYDGLVGRYNADLANNLGNLVARVATVVGSKCGGDGTGAGRRQPARRARRRTPSPAPSRRGTSSRPNRALEATWQLVRATNAHLEANEPWKLDPGPQVDAVLGDALEALRIVAILASPAIPGDGAGDLGAHRAAGLGARPARARRRRVGALPRRPAGDQGPVAVPAHHAVTDGRPVAGSTRTATSPLDSAAEVVAEAVAAGVGTMITVGCDRASSLEALAVAARHPRGPRHGRAAPARGHGTAWTTIADLFDGRDAAGGRRGVRARLPLRPLAA